MAKKKLDFTLEELIAEIEKQGQGDTSQGWVRVADLEKASGHGPRWLREGLRELIQAGRVEVGYAPIVTLNGSKARSLQYRLK